MLFYKRRRVYVIAILVGWLVLPATAGSKILDPQEHDSLLRSVADALDAVDIDLVQSWRSRDIESVRPRLGPLAGYPVDKGLAIQENWMKQFVKGAVGAIAAARAPRTAAANSSFAELWDSSPAERRIFISFAREDVATAREVKRVLEANGYVAFMYLSTGNAAPPQSPRDAGKMFRTAGRRLVVDTPTSRRKPGVALETLAQTFFADDTKHDAKIDPRPQRVVDVYGRDTCPRTQEARRLFAKTGAKVRYHNVDVDNPADLHVRRNSQYLLLDDDGRRLYPLIEIDGRPVHADSDTLRNALEELGGANDR